MEFVEFILLLCALVALAAFMKDIKTSSGYRIVGTGNKNKELEDIPGYKYYTYDDLNLTRTYINNTLNKHFPYYALLSEELKEKFGDRTQKFLRSKVFILPEKDAYMEMPILASATAIQITFGRKDFLFDPYYFIRIHPEEYFKPGTFKVLAGHVYGNTITLAWNFLLHGVKEHADGKNLGLHEMTHAFEICYLYTYNRRKDQTVYTDLCNNAEHYITRNYSDQNDIYSDYACTSKHEFIAESVELFFERPSELKTYHPEVYRCLMHVLNQDPMMRSNPVIETRSGVFSL
jgi:MtfA peptidase